MASPFDKYEVDRALRPSAEGQAFDLKRALDSVVVLYAETAEGASTARSLGAQRLGNGIVIGDRGLVLTIGYLITEAQSITLLTNDGRRIAAHALGTDPGTGFGLVNALEPLDLPTLPLGDSRKLSPGDPVILAGGGGRAHALAARLIARETFAGYWEYLLDEALFTGPGHPHWNGAALIGPSGALMGVGSLQMSQLLADRRTALINMCVPIELLPPIVDDLAHGRPARPPRPWMGLISQEAGEQVVVVEVAEASPAEAAGVRPGDVVLAVDGQPVADLADLYTKVWALGAAGVAAPLRLRRGAGVLDLTLHTIDRATRLKKPRFN
jgi:S1-C subfamily serine protease